MVFAFHSSVIRFFNVDTIRVYFPSVLFSCKSVQDTQLARSLPGLSASTTSHGRHDPKCERTSSAAQDDVPTGRQWFHLPITFRDLITSVFRRRVCLYGKMANIIVDFLRRRIHLQGMHPAIVVLGCAPSHTHLVCLSHIRSLSVSFQ